MKRGRNQRRRPGGANPNRALDSNGPDVRIRGTANQIYDKYQALARDATSSGDRVKAENYLQHAEHYFRLIRATQQVNQQPAQDGEQPSIGNEDAQRDNGRDNAPRENNSRDHRRARPQMGNGAAEADHDGAPEESETNRAEETVKALGEEEKKPRRKRAPRKSVKREDAEENSEASDDEPTAAAAE